MAVGHRAGQAARELSEQLSYERLLQSSLPNAAPSQITLRNHYLAVTHTVILQVPELTGFLTFLFKKKQKLAAEKSTLFLLPGCRASACCGVVISYFPHTASPRGTSTSP